MADVATRPPREAVAALPPAPPPQAAAAAATTTTAAAAAAAAKKSKSKKTASDPNETQRQLAARIAQFEQDQAGKVEEDAEIEREVRKANREMKDMLSTMGNANTKADHLHKKWMDLLGELKKTEREHSRAKKRADQVQKEKDTQRSELIKANSVKDKLERLSREITKDNKRLKDELREAREAAEGTNEELHRRLEQMMDDVELVVQSREDPAQFLGQMEEDEIFREKFKSMVEQYEMREIHFASVLRARDLEIQYHIAQHERLKKAQDAELTKSHQLTRQVSTFSQTENELRSQLNIYVEKFKQACVLEPDPRRHAAHADLEQVEDTLNNSNDLFLTFRKEMEEMSKKTKRLEKENVQLTRKQEATNKNIFQMAEERTHSQQERDRLVKENDKLRQICRAMQTKGYGRVAGGAVEGQAVRAGAVAEGEDMVIEVGGTDSDYDDEDDDDYDDEVEEDSEDEYDDETEEDEHPPAPRAFGPLPPPPPPPPVVHDAASLDPQSSEGGRKRPNGVNGTRH